MTLNGTGSTDPNGKPLTYLWSILSAPANSTSAITNPTASMPTLKIDVEGNFVIQLVVNDGTYNSNPSTVTISTTHTAPTANAGPSQTGAVGTTIQLDGSGSVDPDGNPLTHAWTLVSVPSGSAAALSSATAVKPTFTLDKFGTYIAQLIVSDQFLSSTTSTVTITTTHTLPVANAGASQSVTVGSTVTLDGSQSTDIDGFPLTYSWSLISVPSGSTAAPSGATTAHPTFVLDVAGTYVAQLIVNDGFNSSTPATVTISTTLLPPVANAGPAQTVALNSLVQLNGSASTDPNHLALTYLWSFLSVPSGSASTLSSTTAINPTFTADKQGTYVVQLIVNDGTFSSTPSTVSIDVPVPTPVANAGPNQIVAVGSTVNLTGLASSDPGGNSLTYAWSFVSSPGTAPTLNNATSATPNFVAATAGNYVVQLIVNNGTNSSAPSTVQITAAAPSATLSVPSLSFSNQAINTSSTAQSVTFTNTGTVPITLTSVGATGDFANLLVSTCGSSVAVGNNCTVSVVFSPTAIGTRTGTLSFNDNIAGSPQTVSLSGSGISGTATKLAFAVEPSNATAGAAISPAITVKIEDASGNTVTSATTAVTLAFGANPGSVSLSGTTTVTAVNGIATFANLSLNTIGTGYTLIASGPSLTAATSSAFNITPGTASKLAFTVQPTNTNAGAAINRVQVTVQDAQGNTVTTSTASVTLAIGTNPASGALSGTLTVVAVNGVAAFNGLSINNAGSGYTLTAASTGLASATSNAFNVVGSSILVSVAGPLVGIGSTLSGSFTLGTGAPAGGVVVNLASSVPANVTISPATVSLTQGQTTGSFTYTGVAAGSSSLSASATGYVTGSTSVTATSSLISFGAIPTVALGGTQSLPLSLGTAAPAGGLTVTLTSSNPSIATVTSTVFIAAGSTVPAANPQITGVSIGTTKITATGTAFAPASGPVTVSTTATITPSPLSALKTLTTNATLTISGAAPAGGLTFTLSTDNTAYATVPAAVTIPAGDTSAPIPVTGTGVGTTTLRADYPGITEATDPINVAAPPAITVGSLVLGNNTYSSLSVSLSAAPTTNETMTVTSSDPLHFLLSTNSAVVGTASVTVPLTKNSMSIPPIYIQGQNYTGNAAITATITATATGYTNVTGTATLYPTGLGFTTASFTTTTFSSPTTLSVYLLVLNPGTLTTYTYGNNLGPQAAPPSFSITSGTTTVGTISGSPASIPIESYYNNSSVSFTPLTAGNSTLTLTQPAGYSIPTGGSYSAQQIVATVTP